MPDLIKVSMEDDGDFLLEVDRYSERIGRGEGAVDVAQETFQKSLDRVRSIADQVAKRLSTLPHQPDRVRVEFGVKFTGEANIILTRTAGEGHFLVEFEWTRRADRDREGS
jgi:hypothetical protein